VNYTVLIRTRLDALACAAATGAEALDGALLDLPPEQLASLALELDSLAGRLELVLDRLGAGVDPGALTPAPSRKVVSDEPPLGRLAACARPACPARPSSPVGDRRGRGLADAGPSRGRRGPPPTAAGDPQ
jgi:hypothetical protein